MKSHENNPNRVNKVHETSFWQFIQERLLEVARFPREELGEKCEKHILQEITEEAERRARFSGQLRERFTVGTEIEEYRSIKCWHINRGGVLLHRNRGGYDLHLMLYGCINFCTEIEEGTDALIVVRLHLIVVRSGTKIEAELLLVLAHFSRRK